MIGTGAVMGWTPEATVRASVTDYLAAVAGWARAHGSERGKATSEKVAHAHRSMAAAADRAARRRAKAA